VGYISLFFSGDVNSLVLYVGYGSFSGLFAWRMKSTESELGETGSFDGAIDLLPWSLGVALVVWFYAWCVFGGKKRL